MRALRKVFYGDAEDIPSLMYQETLIYDDNETGTVVIKIIGQFGYTREVDIKKNGSYIIKYTNPFSEETIEKEVKKNKTNYTYNNLKSETFNPTAKLLYTIFHALVENGSI